jgi:hypothetical protein
MDKPIFLSVGYSTCHWCHVMEVESFENEAVAQVMNDSFVNIKVDREERPDIDRVYMTYVQASSGSGGWPMSVWLTPTLKPMLGATYFPPHDKWGRPGFATICKRVLQVWREQRTEIEAQAEQTIATLQELSVGDAAMKISDLTDEVLTTCYKNLEQGYDILLGGFSLAPKFPRTSVFSLMFHIFSRGGPDAGRARDMSIFTLKQMANGGIYDHLAGGFHRYSVTADWHVPHFEKMLYDQAQLVTTYLDAFLISRDHFFSDVAEQVMGYVMQYMTHRDGGIYSAEDADSYENANDRHKKEGAFYVWTKTEIEQILGEDATLFSYYYGVKENGNVEPGGDPHGEFTGKNILAVRHSIAKTATHFNLDPAHVKSILSNSRKALLVERNNRPRPHLDDKIITAWNGLMISAFAKGYAVLGKTEYLHAAIRAAEFIKNNLYNQEKCVLTRNFREGPSAIAGFADDYAFLIQGLIDIFEATLDIKWLRWTLELQRTHDALFYDKDAGGVFSSAEGDASVLVRMKKEHDGAEPSNQSVAVLNWLRLSHILGAQQVRDRAEQTLASVGHMLHKAPSAAPLMVCALGFALQEPTHVVVAGPPTREDTVAILRAVHSVYRPVKVVMPGTPDEPLFAKSLEFLGGADMLQGKATVYVCEDFTCMLPTNDPKVVVENLAKSK